MSIIMVTNFCRNSHGQTNTNLRVLIRHLKSINGVVQKKGTSSRIIVSKLSHLTLATILPRRTSLATHFKLSSSQSPSSEDEAFDMKRVTYASVVGSLMYAMICTR